MWVKTNTDRLLRIIMNAKQSEHENEADCNSNNLSRDHRDEDNYGRLILARNCMTWRVAIRVLRVFSVFTYKAITWHDAPPRTFDFYVQSYSRCPSVLSIFTCKAITWRDAPSRHRRDYRVRYEHAVLEAKPYQVSVIYPLSIVDYS